MGGGHRRPPPPSLSLTSPTSPTGGMCWCCIPALPASAGLGGAHGGNANTLQPGIEPRRGGACGQEHGAPLCDQSRCMWYGISRGCCAGRTGHEPCGAAATVCPRVPLRWRLGLRVPTQQLRREGA